jgi:hypothetical protein
MVAFLSHWHCRAHVDTASLIELGEIKRETTNKGKKESKGSCNKKNKFYRTGSCKQETKKQEKK